mmetsp:Transcript_27133/g.67840  ORF Transcript_27133/g.67840 Transcript_27133/m.67840 type:complete len:217 (-) Transcript_27133:103-753(-)
MRRSGSSPVFVRRDFGKGTIAFRITTALLAGSFPCICSYTCCCQLETKTIFSKRFRDAGLAKCADSGSLGRSCNQRMFGLSLDTSRTLDLMRLNLSSSEAGSRAVRPSDISSVPPRALLTVPSAVTEPTELVPSSSFASSELTRTCLNISAFSSASAFTKLIKDASTIYSGHVAHVRASITQVKSREPISNPPLLAVARAIDLSLARTQNPRGGER